MIKTLLLVIISCATYEQKKRCNNHILLCFCNLFLTTRLRGVLLISPNAILAAIQKPLFYCPIGKKEISMLRELEDSEYGSIVLFGDRGIMFAWNLMDRVGYFTRKR